MKIPDTKLKKGTPLKITSTGESVWLASNEIKNKVYYFVCWGQGFEIEDRYERWAIDDLEQIKPKVGSSIIKPIDKPVTPIKNFSDKKQKELAIYRKRRDLFLKENTICQFEGCTKKATELHHAKGRIGANLIDVSTFRALCTIHHRFCELNPTEAKKRGLSDNRI